MKSFVLAMATLFMGGHCPGADALDEDTRLKQSLGFIGAVAGFQGQFDSVVRFCKPHVPALLVEDATRDWRGENHALIELKKDEIEWVVETARRRGTPEENLAKLRALPEQTYQSALADDRLIGGLKDQPEPRMGCAKLLGNMVSSSMKFSRLAPDAWAYYQRQLELRSKASR